jgi:hypothetical protein|nr:MAG TPA: hypothetical protein [Caudoviricetes sp.]
MTTNLLTEAKVAARIGRHRYLVALDRAAGHLTPEIEYAQTPTQTVRLYTETEMRRYDAWLQKTHRAPYNRKAPK